MAAAVMECCAGIARLAISVTSARRRATSALTGFEAAARRETSPRDGRDQVQVCAPPEDGQSSIVGPIDPRTADVDCFPIWLDLRLACHGLQSDPLRPLLWRLALSLPR